SDVCSSDLTTRWDKEISTNPLVAPAHPLYAHVNREGESTVLRAHLVGALTLLALVFARSPQAFAAACSATPSCDGTNALANTQNILCCGSSVCTPTAVTVKENINISIGPANDFTKAQCVFDLGGRTLAIQKTLQVPGD